ncbi:ferrochelatase [Rivibacter subsaxonicus]|uniref:Ferrochelatase n=1 Tax=Rivibacter subsaxonicus TaxID=457575 RepID=A0A4Q7W0K5_9BURK|nr:ferrochelatase [Rivibacter subsaxonicus]RZU02533.1 ferrochelatase [Rivibacter subsaxonicus]
MPHHAPEPAFVHGQHARIGVLLFNLGTPDAPTAPALRRYLAEFLSDPRVVEIPRALWLPLLYGIILVVRPAKSAAKYASIWTAEGSPLAVWTRKQATLLRGYLGERLQRDGAAPPLVRHAMRYGKPAIASALDELKAEGATRILLLPLYPQYSATTTASAFDKVYEWASRQRRVPELRFVNSYHDDPGYIEALALSVLQHWQTNGRAERLVMSFHGVPERTLQLGDPYHCECLKTARLLAERLTLPPERVKVTFQSRFGKARWLEPYTEPTLVELARSGVKSVDLICPGFTGDCLETLEEIDQEARAAFLQAGGASFNYIPCLNDRHEFIAALAGVAIRHMGGWPLQETPTAERESSAARARAAGATR